MTVNELTGLMWYVQEIEIVDAVPIINKEVTPLFKGPNWTLQNIVYKELCKKKVLSYGVIDNDAITIIVEKESKNEIYS